MRGILSSIQSTLARAWLCQKAKLLPPYNNKITNTQAIAITLIFIRICVQIWVAQSQHDAGKCKADCQFGLDLYSRGEETEVDIDERWVVPGARF